MILHSKRYKKAAEAVPRKRVDLDEALDLLFGMKRAKFNESVDLSVLLGIDPKKTDQAIRGSFALPHGTGKKRKVLVFAEGEKAEEARRAGAEEVGGTDLVKKVAEGFLDFDVALAVPDMMREISKLGRVLGPKGLMPSPKSGTVTEKIADAVREFQAGKIEYRADDGGNLHTVVGKMSFEKEKLRDNVRAFLDHLAALRPPSLKGAFIQKVVLSATMSPGIAVEI